MPPAKRVIMTYNMPFRGIAKMTGGAVSMEMVYGIVDAVNGHFMRGVKKSSWRIFQKQKK